MIYIFSVQTFTSKHIYPVFLRILGYNKPCPNQFNKFVLRFLISDVTQVLEIFNAKDQKKSAKT